MEIPIAMMITLALNLITMSTTAVDTSTIRQTTHTIFTTMKIMAAELITAMVNAPRPTMRTMDAAAVTETAKVNIDVVIISTVETITRANTLDTTMSMSKQIPADMRQTTPPLDTEEMCGLAGHTTCEANMTTKLDNTNERKVV